MKRKLNILLATFVLAVITLGYYSYYFMANNNLAHVAVLQKCPDSYATDTAGTAEYLAASDKFTNDFFDSHPGASLSDWSKARVQFYKDNGCDAELKRYNDLEEGKGDTATIESVKRVKNEMIEMIASSTPTNTL